MLFNSYPFLFCFFPLVLAAYWGIASARRERECALILASFAFYAWWDYRFLGLLLLSIVGNYSAGCVLRGLVDRNRDRAADVALSVAVLANLSAIGFFKYAHFFISNVNSVFGSHWEGLAAVILPLGISFFTFEQISFLVDIRRREVRSFDFIDYTVFIAFFPRLIAGPILRYTEIGPQLSARTKQSISQNLMIGLTIFFMGLVKKTVLADGIAPYVSPAFTGAAAGQQIDFFMAWGGALAYTCQLYFDFSAYSDMAIGIARCFGIRFPMNFFSPYKSTSIVEFWQRWHITLSRFLRDYVYIGLGGNRRGRARRYLNLMVTMLLGGLWHGANWTFVAWGGLHGLYLIINHAWRSLADHSPPLKRFSQTSASRALGWALTFSAVIVGWVFFRASDFDTAITMLRGMAGLHGAALPSGLQFALRPVEPLLAQLHIQFSDGSGSGFVNTYLWVFALLFIAFFLPATQQIMAKYDPVLENSTRAAAEGLNRPIPSILRWDPTPTWAVVVGTLAFIGAISVAHVSEFLYWQF
jgi:D-alanyl-lipoteichoic acid acyltransferase DltB (MBOAT superfamily)